MPKASKRTPKLDNAAKAAPVTSTPVAAAAATPAVAKPERKKHEISKRIYTGASPNFRGHLRKLTPFRRDYPASGPTERDNAFVAQLQADYAARTFQRLDIDAGNLGRAYTLGYVIPLGDASTDSDRNASFKLTPAGLAYNAGKPATQAKA